MYDLKPFELNAITDRVAVEHARRQNDTSVVLLADKHKQKEPSHKTTQKDENPNGHKRNNNKSKKKVFNKNSQNSSQCNTADPNKRL
ncbi:hypothetical protein O181_075271 [Austropuccinia psidii MF-1]|uniref:Uncharacterized protein n=1 Tax=Austropuccinia psidii MF-1 TaxID=1389203 RepID=A0A9Q3IA11_9BASI|nr:hypothetical protein [Austropuccinia psidii MF-1]